MAGWTVVPNLNELLEQMNARFPKRDKASDGAIGNTSHAARASSHNPDKTGSPEFRDGDSKNEVRARDIDKDLKDEHGVTMEKVVQHWLTAARAGKLPWVRYIIFNKRIWHKRDNFKTRKYTGSNTHEHHVHVNSDFTQSADNKTGTDWLLKGFGIPKKPAAPKPTAPKRDVELTKRIQKALEVEADGFWGDDTDKIAEEMHDASQTITVHTNIKAVQRVIDVTADGVWGERSRAGMLAWIQEFQKALGVFVDGKWGPKTEAAYLAARKQNHNNF
jgi:hypothetical protein